MCLRLRSSINARRRPRAARPTRCYPQPFSNGCGRNSPQLWRPRPALQPTVDNMYTHVYPASMGFVSLVSEETTAAHVEVRRRSLEKHT